MPDADADIRAPFRRPFVAVADIAAQPRVGLISTVLPQPACLPVMIADQADAAAAAGVQIAAHRLAADDVPGEVILVPTEPVRLDVAAEMNALTGIGPVDCRRRCCSTLRVGRTTARNRHGPRAAGCTRRRPYRAPCSSAGWRRSCRAGAVRQTARRWRQVRPVVGLAPNDAGTRAPRSRFRALPPRPTARPAGPSRPSGSVQRICGTRDGPARRSDRRNRRLSMPASESLKFELAWPNSSGPSVP